MWRHIFTTSQWKQIDSCRLKNYLDDQNKEPIKILEEALKYEESKFWKEAIFTVNLSYFSIITRLSYCSTIIIKMITGKLRNHNM